ncbi:PhzF family phenazine biosynthesis protein [Marinibaculum pumilum]|uniref:PhzF family phenazine biosynthesis protein n=1 Tax=Marinibaculum pumilum TaxID=1766165 RepID=A0ABV7KVE9_9PROT
MQRDFITLDVFTDRPFGGNPLAVVLDGRGLDGAAMQRIAAEFNLSETVFLLPPVDPANDATLRIFTPQLELPFAGHPNVGAAVACAMGGGPFGKAGTRQVLFEERIGLVRLDLDYDGALPRGAWLAAPAAPVVGKVVDAALAARAAGLPEAAIRCTGHPPQRVALGPEFVIAEVADGESFAAAGPQAGAFGTAATGRLDAILVLYRRDGAGLQVRVFAPLAGVAEDPATGSANLALGGFLAHLAPGADASLDLSVRQGAEMGRPSQLRVQATKRCGTVEPPRIHGHAVPVMEGRLRDPD